MPDKSNHEARYVLRRAVKRHGAELAENHPWLSEYDRWKELVFALLTRVTQISETEVREITEDLADLDLLDVGPLAILKIGEKVKAKDSHARHILDVLVEGGFSEEEAMRGLKTLHEAAVTINTHFDGKVQRYLRRYGELMLKELPDLFNFSQVDAAGMRLAFTYWLQNVMNMPLSLADENVERFCKQVQLDPAQLFAAADDLDINLAFVDDLVLRELTPAPEVGAPESESES